MKCLVTPCHLEVMETDLDLARDYADFAALLDHNKDNFSLEAKAVAITCVDHLHNLAYALAGNRAGEINAQEDAEVTEVAEVAAEYFKTAKERVL